LTEAECWLFKAKANRVKNTRALRVQRMSRMLAGF
jgi:hypothetical protein